MLHWCLQACSYLCMVAGIFKGSIRASDKKGIEDNLKIIFLISQ